MKTLLSTLLVSTAFATSAISGNVESPPVSVDVMEAPVSNDWGGFYIGGMYAFQSGNWEGFDGGGSYGNWEPDGELYGAFAGYNIQRGEMVFGGELAYSAGDTNYTPLQFGSAEINSDTFLDVKARLGYVFNDVLIYGVAGGTSATTDPESFPVVNLSGFNYGAGVQMNFGDNMLVGIEYLIRDLTGDSPLDPTVSYEYVNETIALRAGWHF